jgi:hypothetical protein
MNCILVHSMYQDQHGIGYAMHWNMCVLKYTMSQYVPCSCTHVYWDIWYTRICLYLKCSLDLGPGQDLGTCLASIEQPDPVAHGSPSTTVGRSRKKVEKKKPEEHLVLQVGWTQVVDSFSLGIIQLHSYLANQSNYLWRTLAISRRIAREYRTWWRARFGLDRSGSLDWRGSSTDSQFSRTLADWGPPW